jgi:NADH-quinone oxidoreductase subunit L
MLVAVMGGLVGIIAYANTLSKIKFLMKMLQLFTKVLYDKYYVDEIYDFFIREINQWPIKIL